MYTSRLRRNSKNRECPFCAIEKGHSEYIEETRFLKVIKNLIPYSVWDGQGVVAHLMIVPKEHTDKLGDLSAEAAVEYLKLIDKYETLGYNLYARAPASTVKTVAHQHSHLIKLDHKPRNFLFLLRKPFYIRLSK